MSARKVPERKSERNERILLRAVWHGMHGRCSNPQKAHYADYGGRGIKVSKAWHSFERFRSDMGPRPHGMTLERKDNNKGYSKSNCVWASRKAQARNRRSSRIVTFEGRTQTMIEWAEEIGLTYYTLYFRLYRRNLPLDVALSPGRAKRSDAKK